ncbi:centrosomal protein of 44 kDa isoform X2 [Clupea harengus]|uniref:Centrosomal protein of 44 kDa n=1 Tax=Clupea harengus TaxID=7950 RepID=A0A6P3W8L4_CLUHA|nr:centrosomal protein of 44 kDa isoform X2 [Clupea harengus]
MNNLKRSKCICEGVACLHYNSECAEHVQKDDFVTLHSNQSQQETYTTGYTMIATGDLKGSLKKLEACLRCLKYPHDVNYQGLARGDPACCLPIVSYALVSHSPYLAEHLMGFSVELTGASDLRFLESLYKVLRDLFSYKPQLSKQQFLQFGFAVRKVSLVCDIINFAIQKHKELSKASKPANLPSRRPRFRPFPPECGNRDFSPFQIHECQPAAPGVPQSRPLVERHMGSVTPVLFSLSSDDQEEMLESEEEVQEDEEQQNTEAAAEERTVMEAAPVIPAAVEVRLEAMEAQLQCCERRLGQLAVLESRLQALERSMAGKVVLEQSHWENLESRVLLLETRLALSETQSQKCPVIIDIVKIPSLEELSETKVASEEEENRGGAEVAFPSPPQSRVTDTHHLTGSPPPHAQENIKERLERIANMMKDTSSLLQSVEPSI